MQSQEVRAFKNELRNYRFYETRLRKLDELIDFCYSLLPGNVHAINYSDPITGGTPNKDREYRIRDEISRHEQNKARTQAKVDYIEEILDKMENSVKEAAISIFVEGNRTDDVAPEYHLSSNALLNRINREIERVINEF